MNIHSESNIPLEYLNRVNRLLEIPAGTIPGSREFGIDPSIQDMPIIIAKTKYIAEISKKIKQFFPDLQVEKVDFSFSDNGKLVPEVIINWK